MDQVAPHLFRPGGDRAAIPAWKDKLKLSTRRVRLLALYTPDVLKTLQDGDTKERDEVEALLTAGHSAVDASADRMPPTTQPAADRRRPTASRSTGMTRSTACGWTCSGTRWSTPSRITTATSATSTLALGGLNGVRGRRQHQRPGKGLPRTWPIRSRKRRSSRRSMTRSPPTIRPARPTPSSMALRTTLTHDQDGESRHRQHARRSARQRICRRRFRQARSVHQHDLAAATWRNSTRPRRANSAASASRSRATTTAT